VSLFSPPPPRAATPRRQRVGWSLLLIGLIGTLVLSFVPSPFVVQQPGPTYDTLGSVGEGEDAASLITIDAETFETSGALDLLTVSVVGSRATPVGWFTVISAWFDSSRSALPIDSVYPEGTSFEDAEEANRVEMENSKREAVAAALRELDYDVQGTLTIASIIEDYPAEGVVEVGDTVLLVDGEPYTDVTALRGAFAEHGAGEPVTLSLQRGDEVIEVEVTPTLSDGEDPIPVIGVGVQVEYDVPIDVEIELDSVGGPSAGMMFALGVIDKLTPGELTGGEHIAGTGTITGEGEVGAIGGVRQKMHGARDAGANWMLVPSGNCTEVVGNEPSGLTVIPVDTLEDATASLELIANDRADELESCG
jgi:PDZ domain-containing protein